MATNTKALQTEEDQARKNEGIIVADEAVMALSRERAEIDKKIEKLTAEKATISSLIKDSLKDNDAVEIVDEDGKRVWFTDYSYSPKFDVKAMIEEYPILAPLVRRFTKTTATKKLYFSKPEGS